MNKLEFIDSNGKSGYIEYTDSGTNWSYNGTFNIVYEILFSVEGIESHGRPEGFSDEIEIDSRTELTPEEKIRKIKARFYEEGRIHAIKVNGEVV
jgi:hypothetical protein